MSLFDSAQQHPSAGAALADAFAQALADFAKWRRRRKAIADLRALSDRSLADIGIERSEIRSVVMSGSRDASRRTR